VGANNISPLLLPAILHFNLEYLLIRFCDR
jgi:hypothetical protein